MEEHPRRGKPGLERKTLVWWFISIKVPWSGPANGSFRLATGLPRRDHLVNPAALRNQH